MFRERNNQGGGGGPAEVVQRYPGKVIAPDREWRDASLQRDRERNYPATQKKVRDGAEQQGPDKMLQRDRLFVAE